MANDPALHRQPAREPGDKRAAILDAALALFAERGFHGTAVPLVAARAGVGAGTMYRYFPSKEALVNALYRHWKQVITATMLESFPLDAEPRALFAEGWRRLSAFATAHPRAFVFLELHHHAPYLDEESRAADARVLLPLRAFVEQAQRTGAVRDDPPELLMALVFGAVVGVVRAAEAGHLPVSREDALARAEARVWEAIRR
ncbi:MAG: TetR/AcrR family transcriptional regulator [Deltaproteobacteria bacterium]|nr:TetR/AcrR family transcriptional regulator [Deltaproteobacteria bacterium]